MPPAVSERPFRVLVIDDNVDAANVLSLLLRKRGNEVKAIYNGADALVAAGEFQPDCIISDIGMPVVDGFEVARRFRADQQFTRTPLIALTAYNNAAEASAAGFDYHVVKAQHVAPIISLIEQIKVLRTRVETMESASEEQAQVLVQVKDLMHDAKDNMRDLKTELKGDLAALKEEVQELKQQLHEVEEKVKESKGS